MEDTNSKEGDDSPGKGTEDTTPKTCRSVSECAFVSNYWRAHTDKEWTIKNEVVATDGDSKSDIGDKTEDDVAGVSFRRKNRLLVVPSSRLSGSNKDRRTSRNNNLVRNHNQNHNRIRNTWFHPDLKTDDLDGMVVMFQAKANHSIAVVLSSFPSYDSSNFANRGGSSNNKEQEETETNAVVPVVDDALGDGASTRYEIVLGANKNSATTIRRSVFLDRGGKTKRSRMTDSSSFVTIPSRVCRGFVDNSSKTNNDAEDGNEEDGDVSWTSYWVCLSNSKLYVGMGSIPGKECFGKMENEEEEKQEQEGESSSSDNIESANTPTVVLPNLPVRYVGIGSDPKNHDTTSTMEVRNLVVTNVPPCLESLLKEIPSQDELPIVCLPPASSSTSMDVDEDAETLELKRYMEQYRAECLVRKRRAQKYGTRYKEQPMKDFLPWTMAKRLLLGDQQQSQRQSTTSHSSGFEAGDIDFLDPEEISKREARLARFAAAAASAESKTDGDENEEKTPAFAPPIADGLPVEQAWDKEGLLRPVRRDPPPYLWNECPSNAATIETVKKPPDPFAMYDETTKAAVWIEDKLHVSAIDWAAFKQIGNEDLVKHFGESYGPIKYIEWLGDVNCNICFGSKQSAARALVCLANELPSPPPLRAALASASATPTDENNSADEANKNTSSSPGATAIDLGCMTWKFGKKPIRKLSNDRRGRKGTTARYLLRMATTEDVLVDRPNHWPEPPGGFSSDRVLGPRSDFANVKPSKRNARKQQQQLGKQQNPQKQLGMQQQNRRGGGRSKRKRQRGGNDNHNATANERKDKAKHNKKNSNTAGVSEGLLNRGLSSTRAGFSVEEMEKERQAKKRQKTS